MEAWFKRRIIAALRKLTYSWPPRNEVRNAAKVAPSTYVCNDCGVCVYDGKAKDTKSKVEALELNLGKKVISGKVYVDHIKPIVNDKGFTTWDDYINDMFCSADNLQVLCFFCHNAKTKKERMSAKVKK